jgi:manganese transport protein
MAIGIQLLTGLPLIWGVSITVLDTFLLLWLQRLGIRKMEAFIITLVAIIAICFLIQMLLAQPPLAEVARGFIPGLPDDTALFIAIGIIGATVMPHNLYLHSALVQTRKIEQTDEGKKIAIKYNMIDTTIALNIAFLVNAAILVLAATVFFKTGNSDVAEIKEAHRLLPGFLGNTAPVLFALALIAAGQSSTVTGTLAGQIVMEGYLSLRINPILRRLITRLVAITPALIVILIYGEEKIDALLIMSQVILSLQLGFAVIPLIHFVSDKVTMGNFAIKPLTKVAAWIIASILVFLNLKMLFNEVSPVFDGDNVLAMISIIAAGLFFGGILVYIIIQPFLHKGKTKSIHVHPAGAFLAPISSPTFDSIAVALDFSENDSKILSYAIGQGHKNSNYILLHIVESASAKLLGKESDDYETRKDTELMNSYITQLSGQGYTVHGEIGYRDRVKEIVRIVKEKGADILVIGAHGHTGLKDFIYGTTVNAVRHELKIPVLVVTL